MKPFKQFLSENVKFKGVFNWYGENIILYTYANSSKTAYQNMISQLSKKVGKDRMNVNSYIKNKGNSYKIEEVK